MRRKIIGLHHGRRQFANIGRGSWTKPKILRQRGKNRKRTKHAPFIQTRRLTRADAGRVASVATVCNLAIVPRRRQWPSLAQTEQLWLEKNNTTNG